MEYLRLHGPAAVESREAHDAAMCVQLIETAYTSARADGKQLAIGAERAAVVKAG